MLRSHIEKWSHPEPNSGCWLWLGHLSGKYGGTWNSISRRQTSAHRLSYEAYKGPIRVGLSVLHRCDTPLCVNPAHLFLGTAADNIADMVSKGRQSGPKIPKRGPRPDPWNACRGEKHGRAKLTEDAVRAIRASGETCAVLAARFSISVPVVSKIRLRQSWRHIP